MQKSLSGIPTVTSCSIITNSGARGSAFMLRATIVAIDVLFELSEKHAFKMLETMEHRIVNAENN